MTGRICDISMRDIRDEVEEATMQFAESVECKTATLLEYIEANYIELNSNHKNNENENESEDESNYDGDISEEIDANQKRFSSLSASFAFETVMYSFCNKEFDNIVIWCIRNIDKLIEII